MSGNKDDMFMPFETHVERMTEGFWITAKGKNLYIPSMETDHLNAIVNRFSNDSEYYEKLKEIKLELLWRTNVKEAL